MAIKYVVNVTLWALETSDDPAADPSEVFDEALLEEEELREFKTEAEARQFLSLLPDRLARFE